MNSAVVNQMESLPSDTKEEERTDTLNKETAAIPSGKDGEPNQKNNLDCSKTEATNNAIDGHDKVEYTAGSSVSEGAVVNPVKCDKFKTDNSSSANNTEPITIVNRNNDSEKSNVDLTPTVQPQEVTEKERIDLVFSSDDLDKELTDILEITGDSESGGGRKDQVKDILYVKKNEMEGCDVIIIEEKKDHVKEEKSSGIGTCDENKGDVCEDKTKAESFTLKECTESMEFQIPPINSKTPPEDSQEVFEIESKPDQADILILKEVRQNSNGNKLEKCDENSKKNEICNNSDEVVLLEKTESVKSVCNELKEEKGESSSTENCCSRTLSQENSRLDMDIPEQNDDCVIVSESLVNPEIEGSEDNFEIDDILDNIINFDHSDHSSQGNSSEFRVNSRMVSDSIRAHFKESGRGGSHKLTREKLSRKAVLLNLPEGVSNKDLEKALLDVGIQNVEKLQIVVNKQKDRSFGVVTFTDKWNLKKALENCTPILLKGVLLKLISCDPSQEENNSVSSSSKLGRNLPQSDSNVNTIPGEKLMSESFPTTFYKALASNFPLDLNARELTDILFVAGIKNINSLIVKVLCKTNSCSVVINFTNREQYYEALQLPKCPFLFKGSGMSVQFEAYSEEEEVEENKNPFWNEVQLRNIIDKNFVIGNKEDFVSADRFKAIISKLPDRVTREDLEKTLISAACTINTSCEVIDISDSDEPLLATNEAIPTTSNQQVAENMSFERNFTRKKKKKTVFTAVIRGIAKMDISKQDVRLSICQHISSDVARNITNIYISANIRSKERFVKLAFTNHASLQEVINKNISIFGRVYTITELDEELPLLNQNQPPVPGEQGLTGGSFTMEAMGGKRKYKTEEEMYYKQAKVYEPDPHSSQVRSQHPRCPRKSRIVRLTLVRHILLDCFDVLNSLSFVEALQLGEQEKIEAHNKRNSINMVSREGQERRFGFEASKMPKTAPAFQTSQKIKY